MRARVVRVISSPGFTANENRMLQLTAKTLCMSRQTPPHTMLAIQTKKRMSAENTDNNQKKEQQQQLPGTAVANGGHASRSRAFLRNSLILVPREELLTRFPTPPGVEIPQTPNTLNTPGKCGRFWDEADSSGLCHRPQKTTSLTSSQRKRRHIGHPPRPPPTGEGVPRTRQAPPTSIPSFI